MSSGRDDIDLVSRLVALLGDTRTTSGGWATAAGRDPDAESTAWTMAGAALLGARVPAVAGFQGPAAAWLAARQAPDGSFSYRNGPENATWPTHAALLALTLAAGAGQAASRTKAVEWIVQEHSVTPGTWQRLLAWTRAQLADTSKPQPEPVVVLDNSLDGFGWARETFAWVEPTATAMLALSLQPATTPGFAAIRERVAIGARLLLDRQAPDGGWNYGNTRVLGFDLPGYPDTTGWALLGLAAAQRIGVIDAALVQASRTRGFAALSAPESPTVSPLPVALEILARTAHRLANDTGGRPAQDSALARLREALGPALDGVRDGYPLMETRTAVLALCALSEIDLLGTATETRDDGTRNE